jgi:hypothetical protein
VVSYERFEPRTGTGFPRKRCGPYRLGRNCPATAPIWEPCPPRIGSPLRASSHRRRSPSASGSSRRAARGVIYAPTFCVASEMWSERDGLRPRRRPTSDRRSSRFEPLRSSPGRIEIVDQYIYLAHVARRSSEASWEIYKDQDIGGGVILGELADLATDAAELLAEHLWHPVRSRRAVKAWLEDNRTRRLALQREDPDDFGPIDWSSPRF